MDTPKAIIIAGAFVAVSIMLTNHWQLAQGSFGTARLDRWTGHVVSCHGTMENRSVVICQ